MRISVWAYVALWVVQISTVLLTVALARQVGLLHLRLKPLGPGLTGEGPPLGTRLQLPEPTTLVSGDPIGLGDREVTVILFASPRCSLCGTILDGINRLSKLEGETGFVVAVDDDKERAIQYLHDHGVQDGIPSFEIEAATGITSRPFALALTRQQDVIASGLVNTLEQVEALTSQAWEAISRSQFEESGPVQAPHSVNDGGRVEEAFKEAAHLPWPVVQQIVVDRDRR